MPDITVLNENELRQCVQLDMAAIEVVEDCFKALATGKVVMPPIMSMAFEEENGEVDVKTAHIPGFDGFAIKISPGFFNNPSIGLPTTSGLMILFSAKTGQTRTVLLDNGYLTDVRTAAAGAVAAKYLAPATVETAAVFGTGMQARLQIEAAHLVRPFKTVLVWGRDAQKAKACAEDIAGAIGVEARAVADPEEAVANAQLVVTTTPARQAILKSDWLHPGLHITAMGSDQHDKNEIEAQALGAADLYVCDRQSQTKVLGELRAAIEAGVVSGDATQTELGEVASGQKTGRSSDEQITICDLTGTGAQDTAIANFAATRAEAAGSGTVIST